MALDCSMHSAAKPSVLPRPGHGPRLVRGWAVVGVDRVPGPPWRSSPKLRLGRPNALGSQPDLQPLGHLAAPCHWDDPGCRFPAPGSCQRPICSSKSTRSGNSLSQKHAAPHDIKCPGSTAYGLLS